MSLINSSSKLVLLVLCVIFIGNEVGRVDAMRSNRLIQRCGNDAREFLKWFCMDSSFNFPFSFHRNLHFSVIFRFRSPYKDMYPFQHQASVCCRQGCPESGYQRMCNYHKTLKRCEKSRRGRTRDGRRRRRCRLSSPLLP